MIKELKRALGLIVGGGRTPNQGVIGRVGVSSAGNSIIEIGALNGDGSWSKVKEGGHIALTPEELDELITVLESHQKHRMLKVGDTVGVDLTVVAVQYLNATADDGRLRGTILAWNDHKREWAVLTADPHGEIENGSYFFDVGKALNAYSVRSAEHLYPHFNATPPTLTFGHVADRDKLATGKE